MELAPKEVFPGDLFLLKIKVDRSSPDSPDSPNAEFAGKMINFYQDAADHFIALIPVDIDTTPEKYTIKVKSGMNEKIAHIRVKPYKFLTKKITLPEEKVTLSAEDLERSKRETELLESILSRNTERIWNRSFIKPTDTALSETFGVKRIMNEKHNSVHRGIDYKGKMGTPVKAVNDGTVALKEDLFFGGNTVVIDHGMGLFSIYMHLSKVHVSAGETVSKGQMLGLVGMTGRASGPHLHFGIKLLGVNVNPEALFKLEL